MSMNNDIAKAVDSINTRVSKELEDLKKDLSAKVTALENINNISSIKKLEKYQIFTLNITSRSTDSHWTRLPSIVVRLNVSEKFRKEVLGYEKETDLDCTFDSNEVRSHADLMKAEWIINKIQEYDNELRNTNLEIVAHNTKLRDTFFNITKQLGLPMNTSKWKRNKLETVRLEWYSELSGMFETSHNAPSDSTYRDKKSYVAQFYHKIVNEIKKIKLEEEAKQALSEKKRREDVLLQALLQMYIPNFTTGNDYTWNDLLEEVLNRNPYLEIAHLMVMARNDSGNGYKAIYRCASALPDPAIASSLMVTAGNWEGDGRIFRDCKYNYSELFKLVEPELFRDYETIVSKVGID